MHVCILTSLASVGRGDTRSEVPYIHRCVEPSNNSINGFIQPS